MAIIKKELSFSILCASARRFIYDKCPLIYQDFKRETDILFYERASGAIMPAGEGNIIKNTIKNTKHITQKQKNIILGIMNGRYFYVAGENVTLCESLLSEKLDIGLNLVDII